MEGAPSTHSMSGLSLARHVHGVVWHEHWSSHGGTVLSCGLRFWLPAFIRVSCLVCLLDCNVCLIRCTVLLCCAIRNPFKCWFEHVESRCAHVFKVLLGHSVHFGFGYILGQNIWLRWLPMYWAYQNFRVCVIWASVIPGFSKIGWRVWGSFGRWMSIYLCM